MLFYVGLGIVEELHAGVEIGKLPDAQTVAGVQLGLQEVAAGVPDVGELQEVGRRQQNLHVVLVHLHGGRVHVVDEQLQGAGVDALEGDPRLARLLEAGEHRVEVGAAGGQDHAVGVDLDVVGHQYHITELFLSENMDSKVNMVFKLISSWPSDWLIVYKYYFPSICISFLNENKQFPPETEVPGENKQNP